MKSLLKPIMVFALICGVSSVWATETVLTFSNRNTTAPATITVTATPNISEMPPDTTSFVLTSLKTGADESATDVVFKNLSTYSTFFTPNRNVQSAGSWYATFTYKGTEPLDAGCVKLAVVTYTGDGGEQKGNRNATFKVTIGSNTQSVKNHVFESYSLANVKAGNEITFHFTDGVLNTNDTIVIAATMDDATSQGGCFFGLREITLRPSATRTLSSTGNNWNDTGATGWNGDLPGEDVCVTLNVSGEAALTMDVNATIAALTVNGASTDDSLTFVEGVIAGTDPEQKGALTVSETFINTDTDVSGITSNLGEVTVAEGATLTIGADTTWTSLAGIAAVKSGATVTLPEAVAPDATIEVAGTIKMSNVEWAEKIVGTGTVQVVVPTANQGADYTVTFPETFTGTVVFVDDAGNPLTGYLPDGRYFSGTVTAEGTNAVTFSDKTASSIKVSGLLAGTIYANDATAGLNKAFKTVGNANYFTPDVNVGSTNGVAWTSVFTMAESDEPVMVKGIRLSAKIMNSSGGTHKTDGLSRGFTFTVQKNDETTTAKTSAALTWACDTAADVSAEKSIEIIFDPALSFTGDATTRDKLKISCQRSATNGTFMALTQIELITLEPATKWSEVATATKNASDVTLNVSGEAALTMDVNAMIAALTVNGASTDDSLTFVEGVIAGTDPEQKDALTVSETFINTDTDVSGITSNLGAVTVAEGATLTIGENTTMDSLTLNGTVKGTGTLPATLTVGENGILDTIAGTLTVPATMTWPEGTVRIKIDKAPTAATPILPGGTTLPATSAIYVGAATEAAALTLVRMTDGLGVMPTSDVWLKVDGQWIDSLETAFTLAGTEKPITVAANKTLDALDLSNGECEEGFNLANITKADLVEKTLAFENDAVLTVGTLNLGWNRGFMGWAEDGETPLYPAKHLVVTGAVTMKEGPIEGSPVLMTWSWGGDAATAETPSVTMTTANGGTLTIGNGLTYTAPTADALGTLEFETSLTGKGCWYEWLFGVADADGNETTKTAVSTGRKTNAWNGTVTYLDPAITVDGKTHQAISLSGSGTPYLAVDYTNSLEAPNWSASLFARMPSNAGGILIAFGAANSDNKALVLMRGAEKNQMLLVYMPGDNNTCAQVLADMPVQHGEDAYHLYSFVKYGRDPDDSTTPRIEIFLDNELFYTQPGDFSVSTGLQLGKTYGDIHNYAKWTVDGITVTNDDGTEENLPMVQGTSGSIDMLRIYDCFLTKAEVARIAAEGYTYSAEDVYSREVNGGTVSWNEENTWTKSGEESPAHAEPVEEAVVTLTATADTTITMNPSATVGEETVTERLLADLTLGKLNEEGLLEGDGTITFATNSGSPHMKVEGITTVNTSAVVDCLALSLEGSVHVAAGKTLTLHLPTELLTMWAAGGTVVTKPLTGVLTLEGEGEIADTITVTHGTIPDGYALTYGYNEATHIYEATLTPGTYDFGTATSKTWSEMWGSYAIDETTALIVTISADTTIDMGNATVSMGTLTVKRAATLTEGMPTLTVINGSVTPSAIVLENTTLVLTGSEDPTAPTVYAMNISGSGAVKVASGYVSLTGTNTYEGGTEVVGATEDGIAGATVTMENKDALGSGAVTSAGRVLLSGTTVEAITIDEALFKNSDGWTGTFTLSTNSTNVSNIDYDLYGNRGSTLVLNNVYDSLPTTAGTTSYTIGRLEVSGTWMLRDGEDGVEKCFGATLTGSGTIQMMHAKGKSATLRFTGDSSGFKGRLFIQQTHDRPYCIIFGDTTVPREDGKIIIGADKTANVVSEYAWSSYNGMIVKGTLKGSGSISRHTTGDALTFADGATIDATAGTAVTANTVTYPTGVLNVRVPAGTTNLCVLKTTDTDVPAQVEIYVGEAEVASETLIVRVKEAEGEAPAGLYVVSKPTIAPALPGITESTSETVTDALVKEAIDAGVTQTIKEILVTSTNKEVPDAGTRTVDAVEFFDGILKVEQEMVPDSETGIPAPSGHGIAKVAYDFGIEKITLKNLALAGVNSGLAKDYVVLQVALMGGTFRDSTRFDLYRDGELVRYDVFHYAADPTNEVATADVNVDDRRWLVVPYSTLEDATGATKFSVNAAGSVLWADVNADGSVALSSTLQEVAYNDDVSILVTFTAPETLSNKTIFELKGDGGNSATATDKYKLVRLYIEGTALKATAAGKSGDTVIGQTLLSALTPGQTYKVAFVIDNTANGKGVAIRVCATGQTGNGYISFGSGFNFDNTATNAGVKANAPFDAWTPTTVPDSEGIVTRLEVYNGTAWNTDTMLEKVRCDTVVSDIIITEDAEYVPETMAGEDVVVAAGATLTIPQVTDETTADTLSTASTLALSPDTASGGTIAVAEQAALIGEDTGEPGVPAYNLSPDVTVTLAAGSTLQMDGRLTSPVVITGEGVTLGAQTADGVLILDSVDFGGYSVTVTQGTVEVYSAKNAPAGTIANLTIWSTTQE